MSQAYRRSRLAGSGLLVAAGFTLIAAAPATAHGRMGHGPADIPPPAGAHPGQCFAKVREPDAVEHTREQILIKPAGSIDRVTPAVTRVVEKSVVVTPASEQTIVHPAVFKTVWKTVTEPGRTLQIDTPPRYRLVAHRVLVEPAHVVWKRGAGRPVSGTPSYGQTAYEATGEVMCRVLVPARYAVTRERVLVSLGGHREVQGPAASHRVSERVQVSPERVEKIPHPAVTKTVRETVVITPAKTVTVRTPPEWRVVDRTKTVERYGWQPVVCAHPAAPPAPRPVPHYAPPPPPPFQPRPYVAPQDVPQPYGERG